MKNTNFLVSRTISICSILACRENDVYKRSSIVVIMQRDSRYVISESKIVRSITICLC